MKRERGKGYQRAAVINGERPLTHKEATNILFAIWDEHSDRVKGKVSPDDGSDTKNETAKNFLRREVYALARCLLRNPPSAWDTKQLFYDLRGRTTRPQSLGNVFHTLITSIYDDDQTIKKQERSVMAHELEYAHLHDIPPELLCGFLYQSTNRKRLHQKIKDGFIEPAFRPIKRS